MRRAQNAPSQLDSIIGNPVDGHPLLSALAHDPRIQFGVTAQNLQVSRVNMDRNKPSSCLPDYVSKHVLNDLRICGPIAKQSANHLKT